MCTSAAGFQYPQSDRALCNWLGYVPWPADFELSVSPIGSSPLQPVEVSIPLDDPVTLSVSPIGSSPLQPRARPRQSRQLSSFSIPNRIEPSATGRGATSPLASTTFQYPQSDRALCNISPAETTTTGRPPFSIPNRIEPSATCSSSAVSA